MTSTMRAKERAKQEHSIALSDEAAARAFTKLSDEATRLLWAMVRVIASTGTTSGCIGDAVATTRMSVDDAVRGLDELRRVGLMQRTPRGTDRLHPLFGGIGHRLAEFTQGRAAGGGGSADVMPFGHFVGR